MGEIRLINDVIYLDAMKEIFVKLRPVILIIIGGMLALVSALMGGNLSVSYGQSDLYAAAGALQVTATPPPAENSVIGSTTGIVVMGSIIVIIIVAPVIVKQISLKWQRRKT